MSAVWSSLSLHLLSAVLAPPTQEETKKLSTVVPGSLDSGLLPMTYILPPMTRFTFTRQFSVVMFV